ncbi:MAG: hypothetical protein HFF65_06720 [Oscillospiraceae bacterium]|jgi:hypothetical protein|nr:hypothetical protein [Oscillospiraceae bacterium]MCI9392077.1 hypothetical protein [Oscillospiraceae bacterium]
MDQDEKRPASQTPPPETPEEPPRRTAMQNFYEHFRGVPLRYLDIFIGVCAAALVILVILGFLKGRGYL